MDPVLARRAVDSVVRGLLTLAWVVLGGAALLALLSLGSFLVRPSPAEVDRPAFVIFFLCTGILAAATVWVFARAGALVAMPRRLSPDHRLELKSFSHAAALPLLILAVTCLVSLGHLLLRVMRSDAAAGAGLISIMATLGVLSLLFFWRWLGNIGRDRVALVLDGRGLIVIGPQRMQLPWGSIGSAKLFRVPGRRYLQLSLADRSALDFLGDASRFETVRLLTDLDLDTATARQFGRLVGSVQPGEAGGRDLFLRLDPLLAPSGQVVACVKRFLDAHGTGTRNQ